MAPHAVESTGAVAKDFGGPMHDASYPPRPTPFEGTSFPVSSPGSTRPDGATAEEPSGLQGSPLGDSNPGPLPYHRSANPAQNRPLPAVTPDSGGDPESADERDCVWGSSPTVPHADLLADLASDGFGHWLAGFIDGEGCFVVSRQRGRPRFRIQVRDDDRQILEETIARTGIGRLYAIAAYRTSRSQAAWEVGDKAGAARLCVILDRFPLRAKKRHDYALWREVVAEWQLRGPDTWWMQRMGQRIRDGREYEQEAA
jgi:hypothetical protein